MLKSHLRPVPISPLQPLFFNFPSWKISVKSRLYMVLALPHLLFILRSSLAYPPPTPLFLPTQLITSQFANQTDSSSFCSLTSLSMAFVFANHFRPCETPFTCGFFDFTLTQFPFDLSGSSFSISFRSTSFWLYLLNVGFSEALFCFTLLFPFYTPTW